MMTTGLYAASAAITFFWSGAVVSISFLEAWLKFRAPGVTLPIGLNIGRLVFSALNKMEWVLLAGCITFGVMAGSQSAGGQTGAAPVWLLIAAGMLALETAWLLPALDKRARARIAGEEPGSTSTHLLFVAAEVIKVVSLITGGIGLLKLI